MRQYIEIFDYRKLREAFGGRLGDTPANEPNELLAKLLPIKALPAEIFPVVEARAKDPDQAFPQLAMTANLLSAVIVPLTINVILDRRMPSQFCFDLLSMTCTRQRVAAAIKRLLALPKLGRTLNAAKKSSARSS